MLDFPEKFGMKIRSSGHQLRIVDKTAYEEEVGSPLPKNVSLPASRIKFFSNSRSFKVLIILPEKLDTAETIINITRNLFSKLCGNIFLDEKILPIEFYQQNLNRKQEITAAVPEILNLATELYLTSESLDKHCESIAESDRLSIEKQGDEIRKQLAGEWMDKWQEQTLTREEQNIIESIFVEFKESMHTNNEQIFNSITERVKKLNNQLHYILPHEMRDYEYFEKNNTKHYMRLVLNKLEEISSLSDFIEGIYSDLDNLSGDSDLMEISKQIRLRMQQLRREKKVIQFYVPGIPRDEKLEKIRQKFPLILTKLIPRRTPLKDWSKTVKRIEKHYSESIYSKLYSALHCLTLLVSTENNSKEHSFKTNETGLRLKKLLPVLKFRRPEIKATQSTLGIFLEINEQSFTDSKANVIKQRQSFPLEEFKTAWNYFIASVLTMIYYQDSLNSNDLPQGFNAENYTKSILGYVDKQCFRGINYFHIVKLLWIIFDKNLNSNALKFLIFCLQNPNENLRFILHQVMLPQSESLSIDRRLEKLPKFGNAWITAFQNRMDRVADQP